MRFLSLATLFFLFTACSCVVPSSTYSRMCDYLIVDPIAKQCVDIALGRVVDGFLYQAQRSDVAWMAVGYAALRALQDEQCEEIDLFWEEVAEIRSDVCGALLERSGAAAIIQERRNVVCFNLSHEIDRIIARHEALTCSVLSQGFLPLMTMGPLAVFETRAREIYFRLEGGGFFKAVCAGGLEASESFCDDFIDILRELGLHPLFGYQVFLGPLHLVFAQRARASFCVGRVLASLYKRICTQLNRCVGIALGQGVASSWKGEGNSFKQKCKDVNRRISRGAAPSNNVDKVVVGTAAMRSVFCLRVWLSRFLEKYVEKFNRNALAPLVSF